MNPLIEFHDAHRSFGGRPVLRGLSFTTFERGQGTSEYTAHRGISFAR